MVAAAGIDEKSNRINALLMLPLTIVTAVKLSPAPLLLLVK